MYYLVYYLSTHLQPVDVAIEDLEDEVLAQPVRDEAEAAHCLIADTGTDGGLEGRAWPQLIELPAPHVSCHQRQGQEYRRRVLLRLVKLEVGCKWSWSWSWS